MDSPVEGECHTVERRFTEADVRRFAAVSGDTQPRHTDPDEDRLLVHGLLTATLPTVVGSELDVLATSMRFEFVRPVYTGESVTCTWTTESVVERDDRYELTADVVCTRDGDTVLTGRVEGLVWKGPDRGV